MICIILLFNSSIKTYKSFKKNHRRVFDLSRLSTNLSNNPRMCTNNVHNNLVTLKEELEEIRKEKMKGVIIRTKARWIEDGEKPSKYFCALEKRNYVNKTVTRVVDDNNLEYTKQDEILEQIKHFIKHCTLLEMKHSQMSI